jgi:hypothetical protein
LKKIFIYFSFLVLLIFAGISASQAQTVVDKTVVTVSDGVKTELITYSDLLWQLALRPGISLTPPSSENLNIALQVIINQRLIALEAERLPRAAPTETEVKAEIERVLALFSSTAEFENRLRMVGFDSINDENFQQMMRQRVAIEKYIDFRFRSFAVITPEDQAKYYRETFVPEFRRKNPGLIMPSLDEKREEIGTILVEEKVATDIERFLDDSKRRAEIIVLNEV